MTNTDLLNDIEYMSLNISRAFEDINTLDSIQQISNSNNFNSSSTELTKITLESMADRLGLNLNALSNKNSNLALEDVESIKETLINFIIKIFSSILKAVIFIGDSIRTYIKNAIIGYSLIGEELYERVKDIKKRIFNKNYKTISHNFSERVNNYQDTDIPSSHVVIDVKKCFANKKTLTCLDIEKSIDSLMENLKASKNIVINLKSDIKEVAEFKLNVASLDRFSDLNQLLEFVKKRNKELANSKSIEPGEYDLNYNLKGGYTVYRIVKEHKFFNLYCNLSVIKPVIIKEAVDFDHTKVEFSITDIDSIFNIVEKLSKISKIAQSSIKVLTDELDDIAKGSEEYADAELESFKDKKSFMLTAEKYRGFYLLKAGIFKNLSVDNLSNASMLLEKTFSTLKLYDHFAKTMIKELDFVISKSFDDETNDHGQKYLT